MNNFEDNVTFKDGKATVNHENVDTKKSEVEKKNAFELLLVKSQLGVKRTSITPRKYQRKKIGSRKRSSKECEETSFMKNWLGQSKDKIKEN